MWGSLSRISDSYRGRFILKSCINTSRMKSDEGGSNTGPSTACSEDLPIDSLDISSDWRVNIFSMPSKDVPVETKHVSSILASNKHVSNKNELTFNHSIDYVIVGILCQCRFVE
jgi:hypothetical protein